MLNPEVVWLGDISFHLKLLRVEWSLLKSDCIEETKIKVQDNIKRWGLAEHINLPTEILKGQGTRKKVN